MSALDPEGEQVFFFISIYMGLGDTDRLPRKCKILHIHLLFVINMFPKVNDWPSASLCTFCNLALCMLLDYADRSLSVISDR